MPDLPTDRNAAMIARIGAAPVRYPFRFVVLGDSGAAPNPAGDLIFGAMLDQMAGLDPPPLFLVNLGDFAGPGTEERHAHYLGLVERLPVPNICLLGNHDRDDPIGWEVFERVHGARNFQFAHGHTRFIAITSHSGNRGTSGPGDDDLAFLERCLSADDHAHQIVLMHMPPHFDGHYAPHPEWGFAANEREFLAIVRAHRVRLVCCAHVIAYDYHVHDGIPYVVSGGGGWGLCSHYGTCRRLTGGEAPARGSFYHFVEIAVHESGAIAGRVIRAAEGSHGDPAYRFAAAPP